MDGETKGYLYDDLERERDFLAAEVEQLKRQLQVAEFWRGYHKEEHAKLFERLYGIKLNG